MMMLASCCDCCSFVGPSICRQVGGGRRLDLEPPNIDPGNSRSLQRGARNFMNYCSGCHSAKYVRYNTIGKHLDLV